MQAAFPHMRDQGGGSIVNICSLNGVNAHMFSLEYNASKEALRTMTRTAAVEWPELRIALTSGYVGEDVDAVLADTTWPLLRKPYSSDQLRALLERLSATPAS
jgi:NAD(P)-dependent dehydrogenase (short-subunit alcohol dehydrogenase family)